MNQGAFKLKDGLLWDHIYGLHGTKSPFWADFMASIITMFSNYNIVLQKFHPQIQPTLDLVIFVISVTNQ